MVYDPHDRLVDALKRKPRTEIGASFGRDTLRVTEMAEQLLPEISDELITEEAKKLDMIAKINEVEE